jgi:MFS family permease
LLVAATLIAAFVRCGRQPAGERACYLTEPREAATQLVADRLLLAVGAMCAVGNALFVGLFTVLLPAYGTAVWHDSTLAGVLIAAGAGGGMLGTVLYGRLGVRLGRWATFSGCFLLCGPPTFPSPSRSIRIPWCSSCWSRSSAWAKGR